MKPPNDLTALAAACERAARALVAQRPFVIERDYLAAQTMQHDIDALQAHTRAIRAGRVTVNEETSNGNI